MATEPSQQLSSRVPDTQGRGRVVAVGGVVATALAALAVFVFMDPSVPPRRASQTAAASPDPPDAGQLDPHEAPGTAQVACRPVRRDGPVERNAYPVPAPPFSPDTFPCSRCHDRPEDFNPARRPLTLEHRNIRLVHGPREQWCYGCHAPQNRDKLQLAGGRFVDFEQSYELCGQCHGPKLRDWRLGIHGRRTGCWNGQQSYLLCVHCHDPHAPTFEPLRPEARPRKPTEIQLSNTVQEATP